MAAYLKGVRQHHHGGFAVANLPTSGIEAGDLAYATDGRKAGEAEDEGTGVLVFFDGEGDWIAADTGAAVAA